MPVRLEKVWPDIALVMMPEERLEAYQAILLLRALRWYQRQLKEASDAVRYLD